MYSMIVDIVGVTSRITRQRTREPRSEIPTDASDAQLQIKRSVARPLREDTSARLEVYRVCKVALYELLYQSPGWRNESAVEAEDPRAARATYLIKMQSTASKESRTPITAIFPVAYIITDRSVSRSGVVRAFYL